MQLNSKHKRFMKPNSLTKMQEQTDIMEKFAINSCIISNVLKHLEIKDLKTCRLLNSIWQREATIWLKRKSFITFEYWYVHDLGDYLPLSSNYFEGWSPRFLDYIKKSESEALKHDNYKIIFKRKLLPCFSPPYSLHTNFRMFLDTFGSSVKSLEITCNFFQGKYIKTLEEIFAYKFAKLTEITLNIDSTGCPAPEYTLNSSNFITQPTLKRLGMRSDYKNTRSKHTLIQTLLKFIPNLETLSITPGTVFHPAENQETAVDLIYNELEFKNRLTSLTIVSNCFPSINSLTNLTPGLTRLKLFLPKTTDEWEVEKLFEKQRQNIQKIQIITPVLVSRWLPIREILPTEGNLPNFPRLRKLTIQKFKCWVNEPLTAMTDYDVKCIFFQMILLFITLLNYYGLHLRCTAEHERRRLAIGADVDSV